MISVIRANDSVNEYLAPTKRLCCCGLRVFKNRAAQLRSSFVLFSNSVSLDCKLTIIGTTLFGEGKKIYWIAGV